MANIIAFAVLLAIVAAASTYIYKARKKGVKCIGCPDGCRCGKDEGSSCGGNCGGCGGCH